MVWGAETWRSHKEVALEIVNGFVCQTCADTTLAKAGKDPAHPYADKTIAGDQADSASKTGKANASDAAASTDGNAASPAVTFGGVLAQINSLSSTSASSGAPSTSQPYSSGSVFNVTA